MILVDSSVWIDYFRGLRTPECERLDALLGSRLVVTGDLILSEVLQGFVHKRDFNRALRLFDADVIECMTLGGRDIAIQAARNHRELRALGITVRKTVDCIIATCCIARGLALLHSDRDFLPFVEHLGLESVT